jgi:hypothetical protein
MSGNYSKQSWLWIEGSSRSGKTARLMSAAIEWWQAGYQPLILVSTSETRRLWRDRWLELVPQPTPPRVYTPFGFVRDEVLTYYPLLVDLGVVPAKFPIQLRPETEQELATQLWQDAISSDRWQKLKINSADRFVRRLLDFLQLAAAAGIDKREISWRLAIDAGEKEPDLLAEDGDSIYWWQRKLVDDWCEWSLAKGLLTFGNTLLLYDKYLLPDARYCDMLKARYNATIADDVDEYPRILKKTIDLLIDPASKNNKKKSNKTTKNPNDRPLAAFSFNIDGAIRSGSNADGEAWRVYQTHCQSEFLQSSDRTIPVEEILSDDRRTSLTDRDRGEHPLQYIHAKTAGEMLRLVAETIVREIQANPFRGDTDAIKPADIAIVAPGLDAITRYTLEEYFSRHQIPVATSNDNQPLINIPCTRALLALLALVYPTDYPAGERYLRRDTIAEMLVVLSLAPDGRESAIDPVRAGLLADACFVPSIEDPHLLEAQNLPRWDRLGASAISAYDRLRQWIETSREKALFPPDCLDEAVNTFFANIELSIAQIAAIRELLETAEHYWEVIGYGEETDDIPTAKTISRFISLMARGTVTANPFPVQPLVAPDAITLAPVFQYRSAKHTHKWQFWLNVSSPLWSQGGAASLYGAHLFRENWQPQPIDLIAKEIEDRARLLRLTRDLLYRCDDRVFLCSSDLAANGEEQFGDLLTLLSR